MTVTLTSPALGKDVGATHTGPEEAWLLAHGYARKNGYTGPGVSNTGAADTTPANQLTDAANREAPPARNSDGTVSAAGRPYDFDAGGVNDDA